MKKVIIAEKPSVARNIADALNCKIRKDGYIEGEAYYITWAFGHLLTLYDAKDYDEEMKLWSFEKFPFIPESFKYKVKTTGGMNSKEDAGAKKQLNIIKSLTQRSDVSGIITATDYDREGELIALLIIKFLKVGKNIERILINEWTPAEIKRGLENLKPNEAMKSLQDAGISRQQADWIIGINFTSIATLKYCSGKRKVLNIGRVIMPTLKMIYDKDLSIKNFKVQEYHELEATFESEDGVYKGKFFIDKKTKFLKKEIMEKLKKEIKDKDAIIMDKKEEVKKEYPQNLFNLSNLQGFITSKYTGWTSDKVLKVCQNLYENKFITYPRTESTALEESLIDKTEKVFNQLTKDHPLKDKINFSKNKRVFNNAKVESHSAIIPTYLTPKGLGKDEGIVYNEIKNRFLSQFMEPAEYEVVDLITCIKGENYDRLFQSKGKMQSKKGFTELYGNNKKDELLPLVNINDKVNTKNLKVVTKKTKPPAHHTEKTLLKAMETCGRGVKEEDIIRGYSIGTAATRAETINKLKYAGYIISEGKSLKITEIGINLVEAFPIKELMDTDYTGRLEKLLYDMEKGKYKREEFIDNIMKFTIEGVKKIKRDRNKIVYDGKSLNN